MNVQTGSSQAIWLPDKIDQDVPPYLAILHALERDVKKGNILPGIRLAPQRTLASHLGISIATVGRAYREAAALGLISGRPGQGTFVQIGGRQTGKNRGPSDLLNLGSNFAPRGQQGSQIRAALGKIAKSVDMAALEEPSSHQGLLQHRGALLGWLAVPGLGNVADRTFVTNGVQNGLDLALQLLAGPGETVLVENLTYIGFKALAALRKTPLSPVLIDEEGMIPEALETALKQEKAKVVYAMPNLHSVTARTMSVSRRTAIARLLDKYDAYLIEDDVYGFLMRDRPAPIASLIPSRTIYLASFSKMLNVGFRVGVMVVPDALVDQANAAMRSTTWSSSPLLVEVVSQLIHTGALTAIVDEIIAVSQERRDVFVRAFNDMLSPSESCQQSGYHVWLPLPDAFSAQEFFVAAQRRGILVTPPGLASVDDKPEAGVRICLGGSETTAQLESAVTELRELVQRPTTQFLSIA